MRIPKSLVPPLLLKTNIALFEDSMNAKNSSGEETSLWLTEILREFSLLSPITNKHAHIIYKSLVPLQLNPWLPHCSKTGLVMDANYLPRPHILLQNQPNL